MAPERLEDNRGRLLALYDPETGVLSIKARGMPKPKEFNLARLRPARKDGKRKTEGRK